MGRPLLPLSLFTAWLARGERGISSEAIVEQLTGEPVGRYRYGGGDHPYDPSDLNRCVKLLDQHDLAKLSFPGAMASRSPEWAALDAAWGELTDLLKTEIADGGVRAPETYARMKEILSGARQ